ncbi:hypothetical protein FFRU_030210 [Fructobacillus fructosus]|uniref:hypothetical protein n=1 Tax=Fructobacillus fructosus TaxID=1631 RepID=UPI00021955C6|nr:hypothetical protein [Fructobacillus fructosus]KRN52915.1 hypothetical protein IV71_GL000810 [Fructobacillus fructosus KCTC 3544]GAP00981.1 hypothetical protein FFRU_030210 [Fructobacillus fructosus]
MKLFNWSKQDQEDKKELSRIEFLQAENDRLLDHIESLKLELTELEAEKKHMEDLLSRSGFKNRVIRIGMGLVVLALSYGLLVFFGERNANLPWILLIEAAFIIFMGRGEDK